MHDRECWDWCNHCTVCGENIVYGSLCRAHQRLTSPCRVMHTENTKQKEEK